MKKRKKNNLLIACICMFLSISCSAQKDRDFQLMFYNTENLFDTVDNPQKNDNEFLPTGSYQWNSYRYHKKLTNIAKVIATAGEWQLPDVIGLCEVENDTCLNDLIQQTNLYRFSYKFIHYESEDQRGIDVALLYNSKTFTPIFHKPIRPNYNTKKTRDILYVKGRIEKTLDTIHIFVCHFPSRRGGKEETEEFRMVVAKTLRAQIDSILSLDAMANIVVTGDFNDHPNNSSITQGLQARQNVDGCKTCLVNLQDSKADGTYKFQGSWDFLDQGIVSQGFLTHYKIQYHVIQSEGLFERNDKTGEVTPFRTYKGPIYQGGFSDHLPITISMKKR